MTNRRKLSRRERKARMKIIQTCHLNKDGQTALDKYAEKSRRKYAEIWESVKCGANYLFMLNTKKLTRAMRKIGTSANEAASSFSKMAAVAFRRIAVMIAEVT